MKKKKKKVFLRGLKLILSVNGVSLIISVFVLDKKKKIQGSTNNRHMWPYSDLQWSVIVLHLAAITAVSVLLKELKRKKGKN